MADGKWIQGLSPEMRVADAARVVLAARFEVVRRFLPLAAERPYDDAEHVHQLRVPLVHQHDRWDDNCDAQLGILLLETLGDPERQNGLPGAGNDFDRGTPAIHRSRGGQDRLRRH